MFGLWLRVAFKCRPYALANNITYASTLASVLASRMKVSGAISVAEFMKEALTHPTKGYYMTKDVFGKHGDFTTSPEISQIFGELIGIWIINEWQLQGRFTKFQIVEFGPGRGTLANDILRVLSRFPDAFSAASVHLVEVSPAMRHLQANALAQFTETPQAPCLPISWCNDLQEVPDGLPAFFVAHEFLDALPVHRFQNVGGKWYEVLVDLDPDADACGGERFRFVRSRHPALLSELSATFFPTDSTLTEREVCPRAATLTESLCQRVSRNGGAALLIDYGHSGDKGDTFRGFRGHKVCDPLEAPGEVDLTCDVDFALLHRVASSSGFPVIVHGPVTQSSFLLNMGLMNRLQILLRKCESEVQRKELMSGCEVLINPEKMGDRFKFQTILPSLASSRVPAGF